MINNINRSFTPAFGKGTFNLKEELKEETHEAFYNSLAKNNVLDKFNSKIGELKKYMESQPDNTRMEAKLYDNGDISISYHDDNSGKCLLDETYIVLVKSFGQLSRAISARFKRKDVDFSSYLSVEKLDKTIQTARKKFSRPENINV
jgi:hypothetical protein